MTLTLKTKIVRKRSIKIRVLTKLPATVFGAIAIAVNKANGSYTIQPDYSGLQELTSFDPSQELVLLYKRDGTWAISPVSTLVNNPTTTTHVITAGDYVAANNDTLIAVNKTAGAATTITLPLSSVKNGAIRISDFKGDADTNNITVSLSGSDKFPGNLTSWTIAGAGASVLLTPIPGIGYAV